MYNNHRIYVRVGSTNNGIFESNTRDSFEVVIYSRNGWAEALRIAQAQYGGPDRCQVQHIGSTE